MFLVNSRLGLFTAACIVTCRHSFSRSYGVIMPSSLTTLLPLALGFSPHPPVSVYGTDSVTIHTPFLALTFSCFPTSISPGRLLRQRPDRYAIRAGQNLPDKEFRYLRTIIVIAAVYRGLSSQLRGYPLTVPLDLPAPGRRQPLYFTFRFCRDLCF